MASRTEWDQFWEDARNADILEAARSLHAQLKRAGSAEWVGPCPECGGTDRFSVNTTKRLFNCRGSGGGDVIKMVSHLLGCAGIDAAERLTFRGRPDRSRDETAEERAARHTAWAKQKAQRLERDEADVKEAAAKARVDEQHIEAVIGRAVDLYDAAARHGRAYVEEKRGLKLPKRYFVDIKFVAELDYWGLENDAAEHPVKLAVLPAVIAIIREPYGAAIGIAQTYLDPKEPVKWQPTGSIRNSPKKIRGDKKGGMIRLGRIGETMALGEGWENVAAWDTLRRMGAFGDGIMGVEIALAAAVDLGNLAGRSTGSSPHRVLRDADRRPLHISNGEPDPQAPGVIIPDGVRYIHLIADSDSEVHATTAKLQCAVKRFAAKGFDGMIEWPEPGHDFNDLLLSEAHAG